MERYPWIMGLWNRWRLEIFENRKSPDIGLFWLESN